MTEKNKKELLDRYNSINEDNILATVKCVLEKKLIDAFGNRKYPKSCFQILIENGMSRPEKIIWTDYKTEYEESFYQKNASEDTLRAMKELFDILGFYLILDIDGFAIDIIEKRRIFNEIEINSIRY